MCEEMTLLCAIKHVVILIFVNHVVTQTLLEYASTDSRLSYNQQYYIYIKRHQNPLQLPSCGEDTDNSYRSIQNSAI